MSVQDPDPSVADTADSEEHLPRRSNSYMQGLYSNPQNEANTYVKHLSRITEASDGSERSTPMSSLEGTDTKNNSEDVEWNLPSRTASDRALPVMFLRQSEVDSIHTRSSNQSPPISPVAEAAKFELPIRRSNQLSSDFIGPSTNANSAVAALAEFTAAERRWSDWVEVQYLNILNRYSKVTIETVADWAGFSINEVYDSFVANLNWSEQNLNSASLAHNRSGNHRMSFTQEIIKLTQKARKKGPDTSNAVQPEKNNSLTDLISYPDTDNIQEEEEDETTDDDVKTDEDDEYVSLQRRRSPGVTIPDAVQPPTRSNSATRRVSNFIPASVAHTLKKWRKRQTSQQSPQLSTSPTRPNTNSPYQSSSLLSGIADTTDSSISFKIKRDKKAAITRKRLSAVINELPGLRKKEFSTLAVDLMRDTYLQSQIKAQFKLYKTNFSKRLEPDQQCWECVSNEKFAATTSNSINNLVEQLYSTDVNSIWDPHELIVDPSKMDMPMPSYFIRSSHNTYIATKQVMGTSSVLRYQIALNEGGRSIEIDLYGKRVPVIKHGHSFSGELKLVDVLDCIAQHAFTASSYPLFISIEQHAKKKAQRFLSQQLHLKFPGRLIERGHEPSDVCETAANAARKSTSPRQSANPFTLLKRHGDLNDKVKCHHLSPNDLGAVVLIKHKHGRQFDQSITSLTKHAKGISLKSKLNRHLEVRKFDEAVIGSVSEKKAYNLIKNEGTRRKWMAFMRSQLCRAYPNGIRTDSSNLDPQTLWNHGVQMCALNTQTPGRSMYLDHALFTRNGGSGYVPKPQCLLDSECGFDPIDTSTFHKSISAVMLLSITVIGGRFIRSRSGTPNSEQYNDDPCKNPVVRISVSGVPADCRNDFYTTPSKGAGLISNWNEQTFVSEILCPELATVGFIVKSKADHEIDPYDDTKIAGQHFIPVECMRSGFRAVPLYDQHNHVIKGSTILVRVVKTPQGTYYPFVRRQFFRLGVEGVLMLRCTRKRRRVISNRLLVSKSLVRMRIENADNSFVLELSSHENKQHRISANDISKIRWSLDSRKATHFSSEDDYGVLFGLRLWFVVSKGVPGSLRRRSKPSHDDFNSENSNSEDMAENALDGTIVGLQLPCRSISFALIKVLLESNPEIVVDSCLMSVLMSARWFDNSATPMSTQTNQNHSKASSVLKDHYLTSSIATFQLPYLLYSSRSPPCGRVHDLKFHLQQVIRKEVAGNIMGNQEGGVEDVFNSTIEDARAIIESFDFSSGSRAFVIAGSGGCGKSTLAHYVLVNWAQKSLIQQFSFVFQLSLSNLPDAVCTTLGQLLHLLYFEKHVDIDVASIEAVLEKESNSVLLILDDVDLYLMGGDSNHVTYPFIDDLLRSDDGEQLPCRILLFGEGRPNLGEDRRRQLYTDHSDQWYRVPQQYNIARSKEILESTCTALLFDPAKTAVYIDFVLDVIKRHESVLQQFLVSPVLLALLSGVIYQKPEVFRAKSLQFGVTQFFQGLIDVIVQKNCFWMSEEHQSRPMHEDSGQVHIRERSRKFGFSSVLKRAPKNSFVEAPRTEESFRISRETPMETATEQVSDELWQRSNSYFEKLAALAYAAFRNNEPFLYQTPEYAEALAFCAKAGLLEEQIHNVSMVGWRKTYEHRFKFACPELEVFFAAKFLTTQTEQFDPLLNAKVPNSEAYLTLASPRYHLLLRLTVGNIARLFVSNTQSRRSEYKKPLLRIISFISANCFANTLSYIGEGQYVKVKGITPSLYALSLGCISELQMAGIPNEMLGAVVNAAEDLLLEKLSLNGGANSSTRNSLTLVDLSMISSCLPLINMLQANISTLHMKQLVELDVGGNGFGPGGMAILAAGLAGNHSLRKLNISDNDIEHPGTELLVEVLSQPTCVVHELRCHGNAIGDRGAELFAGLLATDKSKLTYIGLMRNFIGNKGAISIFTALKARQSTCCLQMLGLNDNRIGDKGAYAAGNTLRSNSIMTKCALAKNRITDKGVFFIAKELKNNNVLKEILLMGNDLSSKSMEALTDPRLNLTKEYFTV